MRCAHKVAASITCRPTTHMNASVTSGLEQAAALIDDLAQAWQRTAVERDRAGGHAAAERQLLRDSGLLKLTLPVAHGGWGADWSSFFAGLRRLAEADPALAHVYAFHHLQLATVRLYGSAEQARRLQEQTVELGHFWGNALNPRDRRLLAREVPGGFVLDGPKGFCSGSVGSDWLIVSAWHEATQSLVIGALPTRTSGITVLEDWDAFGQRQTDSGTVQFDQVLLPAADVLQLPGTRLPLWATLRTQIAQLILVNLYAGIGQGALDAARGYIRERSRAWPASGVQRAADDPYVQQRYGELGVGLRGAQLLADAAALALDRGIARGQALTEHERAEVAVAVAQAKVAAHRAGLDISSQFFELAGASAATGKLGLDRYWRNLRVHTLHDPIDYKLRDLGRWALDGVPPEPTSYS